MHGVVSYQTHPGCRDNTLLSRSLPSANVSTHAYLVVIFSGGLMQVGSLGGSLQKSLLKAAGLDLQLSPRLAGMMLQHCPTLEQPRTTKYLHNCVSKQDNLLQITCAMPLL